MVANFHPPIVPLFVPGDRPERFAKAAQSGADAVILDLEDAVSPDHKALARANLSRHDIRGLPVIVRINACDSPCFDEDLAALGGVPFSAIMLPKTNGAVDVRAVHEGLGRIVPIIPLIETAAGLASLPEIMGASGVAIVAFGALDYAVDLGCNPSWDSLLMARSEIVFRSRLAGLAAPIDGVTTVLDDPDVVQADAERAISLGFGGKLMIHPRQIAPALKAFLPDQQALAWARQVIELAGEGGAVQMNGMMIDRPVLERARRIVSLSYNFGDRS
ncbi:CoA ester lyase [Ferrovibrio sp.]|uniref:HpcH/HpaI aldolase/citrate lyase family protein n=1 Tax=Ferrovibrio sp. TaxID=1917215 RepID=UPI0035AE03F5